jgi:hypothetical protein
MAACPLWCPVLWAFLSELFEKWPNKWPNGQKRKNKWPARVGNVQVLWALMSKFLGLNQAFLAVLGLISAHTGIETVQVGHLPTYFLKLF